MGERSIVLAKLRLADSKASKSQFQKVKTLGSGAFGCVDLCKVAQKKSYAKKGEQVAIKRMKRENIPDTEMAKREALVLNKLDHQFIVRYLDNFKDNLGQFCIVMEYCDKGTLEDWLSFRPVKPREEYRIWRLVYQFSAALSFLHSQDPPILHNDLKPANILCKTSPDNGLIDIKIADFGVCNVLGHTPSAMYYVTAQVCGVCYLAPEVLRNDDPHISTSADMWSLGALITYVANDREHLFRRERDVFNWRGDSSPMRREFRHPLHDLVLSLLSIDKHNRPSAQQVLQDQFQHPERGDNL